jgi:hypothetical protein
MHHYLTMLLQVQVANRFSLPFSTMSLHDISPALLLLPALYLQQLLPRLLPLV